MSVEELASISVLHVVADLHTRSGGPSRTVVQLADALDKRGVQVTLVSQGLHSEPSIYPTRRVRVHNPQTSSLLVLRSGLLARTAVESILAQKTVSLVHGHGLWLPTNHWTATSAARHKVPMVLHPRGMLEPWALANGWAKKRLSMWLYQWRDIASARVLIATSESEFYSLRNLGIRQPIAIIPNGVRRDLQPNSPPSKSIRGHRTALFLSRIHPKKGILNLLEAWALVRPTGWHLCIAGPDEAGHLSKVHEAIQQLRLGDCVEYVGEADDDHKSHLYSSSDLFVLPTFSENFGVVVAEALAHGLPVITTRGAPWGELVNRRCGWWIDVGVDSLCTALKEACSLADSERALMGTRAQEYARQFNWDAVARDTAAVYAWALGRGARPECLHCD